MFLSLFKKYRPAKPIPDFVSDTVDITPGRPLRMYAPNGQFRDISTDELVGSQLNHFKGWLCGMGVESLYVDMDGNVFGASCRILGKLGNVFEDFEIPKAWTSCPVEKCTCGADLFIPKAKTNKDKALLQKTLGKQSPARSDLRVADLRKFTAMERTHSASEKQIYWEIGRRCNYDCSYCWPFIHNNHEAHKSLEALLSASEKILHKFARGQKVNFIISGGEPTLNPAFLDWVRYISALGHTLSMHSNGSRLPDYYRELIHYGNLNISVHFEFYKKERMLKVIEAITDEKVKNKNQGVGHLEIKFMMAPGRRQEALELQKAILEIPNFKEYCTSAFVPIRDGKNGDRIMEGYQPEDFELFGEAQLGT